MIIVLVDLKLALAPAQPGQASVTSQITAKIKNIIFKN
jgi:hypothetical protein